MLLRFMKALPIAAMFAVVIVGLFFDSAGAAAFTPGNLAIYRNGDGSAALSAVGTRVFIDEYTPAGSFVQSIAVPYENPATGQHRLLAQGNATFEGRVNRTTNGQYLVFPGYDTALGTASPAAGTASSINRVVGRIDWNGNVDTSTALTDWTSGASPRSVISSDGSTFFLAGGDGVKQTTLGSTTSTLVTNTVFGQESTPLDQLMHIDLFDGQLYVSTRESGPNGVLRVDSTDGKLHGLAPIPGGTTNGDTHQFYMADLSVDIAGVDTIYVTDARLQANGGGLRKYSLQVNGTWAAKGGVFGAPQSGGNAVSALRGLTGAVGDAGVVTLYGVRTLNQLLKFEDNSGYDGTMSGIATLLASASTNTQFMGVDFVPVAPSSALDGDFNGDSKVDAADYVAWRAEGRPESDYNLWRANFGSGVGASSSIGIGAAVPEPAARILLATVALFAAMRHRQVPVRVA